MENQNRPCKVDFFFKKIMGLRQMNGGSRSHGGDRTIIMQLFLTVLPFSFVTQDVKIVMVGYLGLVKCTYPHWIRRIWKHLSHTFCRWRYGMCLFISLLNLPICSVMVMEPSVSLLCWKKSFHVPNVRTVKYDPGSQKQMLTLLAWSPAQVLHEP